MRWVAARSFPRFLATIAVVLAFLWAPVALGQPRVEFRLGVAGTPVAEAWNPLSVVVRDAPGATLRMTIDAGGLDLGEVPQRFDALVAPAGGVQRIDLDVPLPSWRRITWRVEQDGRVLASGGLGARERDDRALDLLVTAQPARWIDRLGGDARPLLVAASDLPARAAGWDGVATLIVDGTTAPPAPETLVEAAAAGVDVHLPRTAPAGYDAVTRLVRNGEIAVGAGRLVPLPVEASVPLRLDRSSTHRQVPEMLAELVPRPTWRQLPSWTIGFLGLGFAVVTFVLLRFGTISGGMSVALVWIAALAAAPFVAPDEPRPSRDDAVVVVAGGVGLRYAHRSVASLPAGETHLDGLLAPSDVRRIAWTDGRTVIDFAAGEWASFDVAPRLVSVPDDVRSVSAGFDPSAPHVLRDFAPNGSALIRRADAWWLVLDPGGAS